MDHIHVERNQRGAIRWTNVAGLAESPKPDGWSWRKAKRLRPEGGGGTRKEVQRISRGRSQGLGLWEVPSSCRVFGDQAQCTHGVGGCFLGEVAFLPWELGFAV